MQPKKNIQWKTTKGFVPYQESLDFMEKRVLNIHENREDPLVWLLEHEPIYTAGTSANKSDLIEANKFPVYTAGRGGQYTYHGPGQRVAYVMLDLKEYKKDIRQYICNLEQWIINSLDVIGIKSSRKKGRVGIWIDLDGGKEAKIAAIGVRVRKWVSFHGISLNICPDLSHFNGIVPCGISNHGVTSIKELGIDIEIDQMDKVLKEEFEKLFL